MHSDKNINKYCEPFVGGGAVLFDVLKNYNMKQVYISDINRALINAYEMVKSDSDTLIEELYKIEAEYLGKCEEERKEFYYNARKTFNLYKGLWESSNKIKLAVYFIFLNKTCFNGLYRVNKKGEFNVPIGSYKKPLICDEINIRKVSHLLRSVDIYCLDFYKSINFIDEKTFVYIDPPYRPLNDTSSFNSYNEKEFDDSEQIRLSEFVAKASEKKAKIIISNSDPKNIDAKDDFFDRLYSEFSLERIEANRMINSVSSKRGKITEILIKNY